MRRSVFVGLLVLGPALGTDPGVSARTTKHRTYELGTPGDHLVSNCVAATVADGCDPTGATPDGSVDLGGFVWTPEDLPTGTDAVQVTVCDDVWGCEAVGGRVCVDVNAHNVCGETHAHEPYVPFCGGGSPVVSLPSGSSFGAVVLFLNGPEEQNTRCFPDAPAGATTGGIVDPAAGVYASFG